MIKFCGVSCVIHDEAEIFFQGRMMMIKCGIVVGVVAGLLVMAGVFVFAGEKASAAQRKHSQAVQANTEFALDLFQKLRTEKGDLFICPHSISTAMTMVLAGARGNTEKEIAAALKQNMKGDALNKVFHELETKLNEACGKDNQLMTANALEKSLNFTRVQGVFSGLKKARAGKVNLFLPRFKIESGLMDLIPALKSLGIKDAFKLGTADFQGMGWPKGGLAISQVKHQAVVEVNEQGTEAAGATAVEWDAKSAIPKTPVFRADHPFLFLIREKSTGAVLFLGRFTGHEKQQ